MLTLLLDAATSPTNANSYFPIILQVIIIGAVIGGLVFVTHLLGPNNNIGDKRKIFSCGVPDTDNARTPFAIKYFLLAILFVLFDVEVIFFYPYAINFKLLGWHGFLAIIMFVALFAVSFYYIIKKKVLTMED